MADLFNKTSSRFYKSHYQ